MSTIDRIAHGLAHQVSTDRMTLQSDFVEQISLGFAITRIRVSLINLEMIPPTGKLDPIVTRILGKLCHLGQR
jgi:hypothetical protein